MIQNEAATELRQYIAVIKTRKWTIVIVTIMAIVLALTLSSRQTPLYVARAQLLLTPNPAAGYYPTAENETATIASVAVAELVIRELNLDTTPSEMLGGLQTEQASPTSELINLTFTSADPAFARDAANAFASNYIEFRRRQTIAGLESQRRTLLDQLAIEEQQLARVNEKIQRARLRGDLSRATALETDRGFIITRIQLTQQEVNALVTTPGNVGIGEITRPAVAPLSPSSPNHTSNGILGFLAGSIAGMALAFLQERLDDRFRGRPDVERALETPVLATVPKFPHKRGRELSITIDPAGIVSEAYRNLRTGVQFLASQREIQSFLVTSPSAHEGKTSTVANLGIAISQIGQRVALVSGDLRRPQLEKYFHAESDVGLSTWLLGEEDVLEKIILEHPDIPNLSLITSGRIPSNPAELLTSPRLPELRSRLEESYDVVLFDSPPVLPVADAVIIASSVGAAILVIDAASTRRSAAIHAKEQIERVGGLLVGTVLNAFDPSSTPYYYEPYYYSRYYSSNVDDSRSDGSNSTVELAAREDRPAVR